MGFRGAILKDFRCFTELTVQNIPDTTRLILLIGPNGCGKSSFFDALNFQERNLEAIYSPNSDGLANWETDYHDKIGTSSEWDPEFSSNFAAKRIQINAPDMNLHVRSAYRNDAKFPISDSQRATAQLKDIGIERMIDNDSAVEINYQRLAIQAVESIFDSPDGAMTLNQLKNQLIGDVREAFSKLFPDVRFDGLGSFTARQAMNTYRIRFPKENFDDKWNPMGDGTFLFTRGESRRLPFKSLSSGKKAAFDLILDLVIATRLVPKYDLFARQRPYNSTLFCIDEPESHMNARLQAELLSVLYDLIPGNSQLMLATHSIGMIRRAQDIEAENPGSVVFLDFENRNFDQPQVIEPTKPDRKFWERAYRVALDDLAALVAPRRVVICEGTPLTSQPVRNHSHDAKCYETIFEAEFPETRFVSMGNDREIVGDKRGLAEALLSLVNGLEVVRLIDRDDRTNPTISRLSKDGVRVLSRRNLESYLFDDEVLKALTASVGKADKTEELLAKKRSILAAIKDAPPDDLKPAGGKIYITCKKVLALTQCGNTKEEFMQETLSPLIKPGMEAYNELRRDIFGS